MRWKIPVTSYDPAEQCALVNQMVEAMQNMDGIVDNFVIDW